MKQLMNNERYQYCLWEMRFVLMQLAEMLYDTLIDMEEYTEAEKILKEFEEKEWF